MPGHSIVITCPSCRTGNRVLVGRLTASPTCGECKAQIVDLSHPLELDDSTFQAVVQDATVPVLVDYWASWCPPCRAFAPTLEQYAKSAGGRVLVAKVDVDAAKRTAAAGGIQSIPTIALFVDGREAARHVGSMSGPQLAAFVGAA